MKNYVNLAALMFILFLSCNKDDNYVTENLSHPAPPSPKGAYLRYSGSDYSQHIPIDSASKMISSYLQSINYLSDSNNLRVLYFNADTMRNFLANNQIATLKFSLAHKKTYINDGNYGINGGTSAGALTFILSGLDEEDDDYIYASGNMVYDLHSSQRISIDSGNHMIQSYLSGINYPNNDLALRSMTFDADTMRHYLDNPGIVRLKFIMAHRETYINAGNFGVNCGTSAAGLTFVIVGLGASNQTIYTSNNMVMEHTRPCPSFCTNSVLLTQ